MHDLTSKFSLQTFLGLFLAALAYLFQVYFGVDLRPELSTLTAALVGFSNAAAFLFSVALAVWGHVQAQLKHDRTVSALTQAQPAAPRSVAASALPAANQARTVLLGFALIPLALGCLALTGCATTGGAPASGNVATDVATDLGQGLIVAQDVFTAADAVEENNTGGKLDAAKVLQDAQLAQTSANSTGLATAVNVLVSDVNAQIAAGSTPAATVAAVASTTATAQVTAASTPVPAAPPSSGALWRPSLFEIAVND